MSHKLERLSFSYIEWARQLHNDPEVLSMLTDPHHVSKEEQIEWFSKLEKSLTSRRQIVLLDDQPIGLTRLDHIDFYNKSICVGLDIHKDYRGKGHAKPIYNLIFNEWFGENNFNRLWLNVIEYNTRGIRLYKQMGFVQEGIKREALIKNGQYYNYIMMSILRKEWLTKNDTSI